MAHQQLLEYIGRELKRGITPESLREALLAAGWHVTDISDAFSALGKNKAVPEVPTPSLLAAVSEKDRSITRAATEIMKIVTEDTIPTHKLSRLKTALLIVGAFLVLGGGAGVGGYYLYQQKIKVYSCPEDAKICSDGSTVGRQGPRCEFISCPNPAATSTAQAPDNWKTHRNGKYGFEFRYPPSMQARGNSDELVMILDNDKKIGFSINVQPGGNALFQSIEQLADEEFTEDGFAAYQNVGGADAVRGDNLVMFTKDIDVFIALPIVLWITENVLDEKTFDFILSTFRFVERDDAFRDKESCVATWMGAKDYETTTARYDLIAEDFCEAKVVPSQFAVMIAKFTAEAMTKSGPYPKNGSIDEKKVYENKITALVKNKVRGVVVRD